MELTYVISPPNRRNDDHDDDTHECSHCNKADASINVLQCDACKSWYHYHCVGMNSSIRERPWTCPKCSYAPSVSSRGGTSSRASRLATDLQRLKEKQEMQRKRMELDLQKQFLDEQQKMLDAALADEVRSGRSRMSRAESRRRTVAWVESNPGSEAGAVGGEPSAAPLVQEVSDPVHVQGTVADSVRLLQEKLAACQRHPQPSQRELIELQVQLERCKKQLADLHVTVPTVPSVPSLPTLAQSNPLGTIPKAHPNAVGTDKSGQPTGTEQLRDESARPLPTPIWPLRELNPVSQQQSNEQVRPLAERRDQRHSLPSTNSGQQQRDDGAPGPGSRGNNSVPPVPNNPPQPGIPADSRNSLPRPLVGPTQQQLAARQLLARDLPSFTGDPSEWPIFISNYTYTTEACGYTNGENMVRLQRCLKGHALETVRSRLILPDAVPHVIETLRLRYGRAEILINTLLQKVRTIPPPRPDRLEGLIEYGLAVQALCEHIEAANEVAHLSNPTLLQELVGKLPADQKLMWAGYKRRLPFVDLRTFSTYMADIVRDASSVVLYEPDNRKAGSASVSKGNPKPKGFINSHTPAGDGKSVESRDFKPSECLFCSKQGHRLRDCEGFKNLNVDDRWKKVRSLALCQTCLYGHGRRSCRSNNRCNIDGCQYRHHPLLHSNRRAASASVTEVVENHTHRFLDSSYLFRIIPVTLYGKAGSINVFAFLDEGSSLTLVESEVAVQLGISGDPQPLCLHWTGNTSRTEKNSQKVSFSISGVGYTRHYKVLEARTVEYLNLPSQTFHHEEASKRFDHLKRLPLRSYENAAPKLLIGIDNLRLALPLKVKEGDGPGPVAVKTRLGWCVYGTQKEGDRKAYSYHICSCSANQKLHEDMKQFFTVEQASVETGPNILTRDEQRAQFLLETTTKRIGDRFETGLLWKQDDINLPDSYNMAFRRLQCLERQMARKPQLQEKLRQQIQAYEDKGYAHRATPEELAEADPGRIWYLPLGVVTNAKKPDKVRVIWDAAAKIEGVSLNSALLKGPDQLASLPGILFRFRLYQVAVSADIQEMFHQVQIRKADKHSQRFLWRNDAANPPQTYLMDVATFGATCSPASAQFVKNLNATQHSEQYPRAARSIVGSHYVDDYLESFGSEEEAQQVSSEVRLVHRNGGFTLRSWISNSERVLSHLGENASNVSAKNLNLADSDRTERVLGMLWAPTADELSFSTHMSAEVQELISNERRPTKRQILRCVMTLFDPLGLLAPFLIHGKVLMQNLWRTGADWDEEVSDNAFNMWRQWINMIEFIATIRIPRCYFQGATTNTYDDAEIHVMVDASESAYSCVAYLRTVAEGRPPRCALVAGKAKVAPVKPLSIPRLELQACLLGTRLMKHVLENIGIPIARKHLWTDSTTALSWIQADPRNYRPYVAHRVGEILESTSVSEWRWVPSSLNPADEATKWGSGPYFSNASMWFSGPSFLQLPPDEWPTSPRSSVAVTEELRPSVLLHVLQEPEIDFERFSRWERLERAVAYMYRFVNNARRNRPRLDLPLQQEELQTAKDTILRWTQQEAYPDEVALLKKNETLPPEQRKAVEKSSVLYQFSPIMDDRGIIRQNSRIRRAEHLPYDTRYPVILPRNHPVTFLIVNRYHRLHRHANSETTVNEIRQLFLIPKLRVVVKQVSRQCQLCKIRKTRPRIPPMAPLPPLRLVDRVRPFTYVGLDYFGPLYVTVKKSRVKRWIALFTCLSVRAVHVEVAYTLSTESCISCVRRFVKRKGSPAEFITDNGTNFRGAERILREQINRGLSTTFTSSSTKWSFIPPGAPHMGGAWERLVRSFKAAMQEAYSDGGLDDEGLQTLVVEAEGLVNARPLTYLPLDSEDAEALTPNHFLLGSSSGAKQPTISGSSEPKPKLLLDSWEEIQEQLEVFWRRWLSEYLPVIRRQAKWFEDSRPICEGDLVLVVDDGQPKGWLRGRVIEVIKGSEGRARQAVVVTSSGKLRRPVSKLALLDVKSDRAVPVNAEMHPGEDVDAATDKLDSLPPTGTNGQP